MEYILPIGIFIVFGIVFGVLLTVISKVFAVKVDERAQKITETLPGANCVLAAMPAVRTMRMPS